MPPIFRSNPFADASTCPRGPMARTVPDRGPSRLCALRGFMFIVYVQGLASGSCSFAFRAPRQPAPQCATDRDAARQTLVGLLLLILVLILLFGGGAYFFTNNLLLVVIVVLVVAALGGFGGRGRRR